MKNKNNNQILQALKELADGPGVSARMKIPARIHTEIMEFKKAYASANSGLTIKQPDVINLIFVLGVDLLKARTNELKKIAKKKTKTIHI